VQRSPDTPCGESIGERVPIEKQEAWSMVMTGKRTNVERSARMQDRGAPSCSEVTARGMRPRKRESLDVARG
jgi:hypothetical protein